MEESGPNIRSEGCHKLAKQNPLPNESRIVFEERQHVYFVKQDDKVVQVQKSVTSLKSIIFHTFDSDAVIKKNMPTWANPQAHKKGYYHIIYAAIKNDVRYLTLQQLGSIEHLLCADCSFESLYTQIQKYKQEERVQIIDTLVTSFARLYTQTPPFYPERFGVEYRVGHDKDALMLEETDLDLVDVHAFDFWKTIEPNFLKTQPRPSQDFILLTPEQRNLLLTQCNWLATFDAYQRAKQSILDSWSKKTDCGTLFHLYVERLFNDVADLTAPAAEGVAPLATFEDIKGEIQSFNAANPNQSGYDENMKAFRLVLKEPVHNTISQVLLKPFRTELSVYYEELLEGGQKTIVTAGQLDALMISSEKQYYLLDWKRTDHDLSQTAASYGRMANLSHLELGSDKTSGQIADIDFNKYSIQLSLYACMLKKCFDIDVGDRMYLVQVYENKPLRIIKCRNFNDHYLVKALLRNEYWRLQAEPNL